MAILTTVTVKATTAAIVNTPHLSLGDMFNSPESLSAFGIICILVFDSPQVPEFHVKGLIPIVRLLS